jgi:hypothetical protein
VWKELDQEFPEVFDQYVVQTLWNTGRDTELRRPLTQTEEIRRKKGIPHEQITHDRLWNKRPDGIAFKIPTKTKTGVVFFLLTLKLSVDQSSRPCDLKRHHHVPGTSVLGAPGPRRTEPFARQTSTSRLPKGISVVKD